MNFLTIVIIFIVATVIGGFVDNVVPEEHSGKVNIGLLILGILVGCIIWL